MIRSMEGGLSSNKRLANYLVIEFLTSSKRRNDPVGSRQMGYELATSKHKQHRRDWTDLARFRNDIIDHLHQRVRADILRRAIFDPPHQGNGMQMIFVLGHCLA